MARLWTSKAAIVGEGRKQLMPCRRKYDDQVMMFMLMVKESLLLRITPRLNLRAGSDMRTINGYSITVVLV